MGITKKHARRAEMIKGPADQESSVAANLRASGVDLRPLPPPPKSDQTGVVLEIPPNFELWDPAGFVWGRPGHYPLWVFLGQGRQRSDEAAWERSVAKGKIAFFKDSVNMAAEGHRACGSWPWWVAHESEKQYWTPGGRDTGRGYSGIACEFELAQTSANRNP